MSADRYNSMDLEQKLAAIASEWRETFDAIEDSVWLLDMDRRIIRANLASQRIFGKLPQDIVGLHCCQAVYEKALPRIDCPFEAMLATGKRASVQANLDNNWYEVSVDPIFNEQGTIVRAAYIVKNINTLKKAEDCEQTRAGILLRIAGGGPLPQLLSFIALSIENGNPGMLCSILLTSDDGQGV